MTENQAREQIEVLKAICAALGGVQEAIELLAKSPPSRPSKAQQSKRPRGPVKP